MSRLPEQKKKDPPFLAEGITYLQRPDEEHSLPNLKALKDELSEFFREFHVPGWQIGQIREIIIEGQATSSFLELYTTTASFRQDEIEGLYFSDYRFEYVLKGVVPGMTPGDTPVLRQVDQILALCEKERTKK
jgi:hypothetical protein